MRRSALFLALLLAWLPLGRSLGPLAQADGASWRIVDSVVEPATPTAGDVVILRWRVLDAAGSPVSGLAARAAVVPPVSQYGAPTAPPIVEVYGAREAAAGWYEMAIQLNEAGRWWIELTVGDGLQEAGTSVFVVVAPRPSPAPPSQSPVLLRGRSWVTVQRVDTATGSVVRLTGDVAVRNGDGLFIARRAALPVGPISRLYGGEWRLQLLLTDVLHGRELAIDLEPQRASLQPGSTVTPAVVVNWAGVPDTPLVAVYAAWRLGESWLANLTLIDTRSGERVTERTLPAALRGNQLLPRLAATADGQLLVLERVLRLDATGEVRMTVFRVAQLEPVVTDRWSFVASGSSGGDCLANPIADVGAVGVESPRWLAWCRSGAGTWLGLWDLATRAVLTSLPADPDSSVVLSTGDGSRVLVVDVQARQLQVVDTATGTARAIPLAIGSSLSRSSLSALQRLLFPAARAESLYAVYAALSPDDRFLYVVLPVTDDRGDGIWVYDSRTGALVDHLLPGWLVRGVFVGPDGTVVAIAAAPEGDRLVFVQGREPRVVVTLPDGVSEIFAE